MQHLALRTVDTGHSLLRSLYNYAAALGASIGQLATSLVHSNCTIMLQWQLQRLLQPLLAAALRPHCSRMYNRASATVLPPCLPLCAARQPFDQNSPVLARSFWPERGQPYRHTVRGTVLPLYSVCTLDSPATQHHTLVSNPAIIKRVDN